MSGQEQFAYRKGESLLKYGHELEDELEPESEEEEDEKSDSRYRLSDTIRICQNSTNSGSRGKLDAALESKSTATSV